MAEPTDPVRHEPSLFASTIKEPAPRSGVSIWLAAAAALVIGIGIGFASGYRAGKGATSVAATAIENPAATSGAAAGQPFSESSVQEPLKLNPEPIVPAPETAQAGPPRGVTPAPQRTEKPVLAPAGPSGPPRRIERAAEPAPRSREQGLKPAPVEIPPAGPASVQVVSRPSGAQVIFDGRVIGKTPVTIGDVATGFHDIRLELSGFKVWSTTVGVKAGIATRVAASLEQ